MKRPLLALVALAALATLATAACGGGAAPTATPTPTPTTPAGGGGQPGAIVTPGDPAAAVQTFQVDLKEYEFTPATFNLEAGKTYHFRLIGGTEWHTFTVDDLGIDFGVDPGQTVTFNYTPGQSGTFELVCIPHATLGMVGEISVR